MQISESERRDLVGAEVAMIFQDPMTSLNRLFYGRLSNYGGPQKFIKEEVIVRVNSGRLIYLTLVGIPDPASRFKCLSSSTVGWNEPANG